MSGKPKVGFVGLGMMGMPMGLCLVSQGFEVLAYDAGPAVLEGAAMQPALSGVAAAPTIVLMLPDSPAVAKVMEQLLPSLGPAHLVIDMGSSLPAETRRWAEACAARGARYMDAPVSGSVVKAKAGTLAIMAGGDDATFAQAEPVLNAMGEKIIRTGAPGSGHAMKALNNYVYAAGLLAVCEALVLGEREGLDLSILADVLNASSGRNIASETKVKQEILSGRYAGGFQLGLMRKDLETAGSIAEGQGADAALLALCRARWNEAMAARGPRVDNTEMHLHLKG